jgi:hypothetical protein
MSVAVRSTCEASTDRAALGPMETRLKDFRCVPDTQRRGRSAAPNCAYGVSGLTYPGEALTASIAVGATSARLR